MKVNISDIAKTDGASINVESEVSADELSLDIEDFIFSNPVCFKGKLTNIGGIIRLEGVLETSYGTKCFRCLDDVNEHMTLEIKEDFLDTERNHDTEAYTYEGNYVIIDKAMKDNIILNLPMKHVCREACKGFCHECGTNLNVKHCECISHDDSPVEDTIDPRMEALKKFFN